jgi:hypothetical protein
MHFIKLLARRKYKLAVLAILLAIACSFADSVRAGIRPSFDYDSATWDATNVVLVEATATPGTFKVIHSFKGNLVAGRTILVPALISPKDAKSLAEIVKAPDNWDADPSGLSGDLAASPAGSRMYLFLKRAASQGDSPRWEPAAGGGYKLSTAWLDHGRVFAFQQWMNPGPSRIGPLAGEASYSAAVNFELRVEGTVSVQQKFDQVMRLTDPEEKAAALQAIFESNSMNASIDNRISISAYDASIKALGEMGPPAVPHIIEILNEGYGVDGDSVMVNALRTAAGADAGKVLASRLSDDLNYWKTAAPRLKPEFWRDTTYTYMRNSVRQRVSETVFVVRALADMHYRDAKPRMRELREFWLATRVLNTPDSGADQVPREIDGALRVMDGRQ